MNNFITYALEYREELEKDKKDKKKETESSKKINIEMTSEVGKLYYLSKFIKFEYVTSEETEKKQTNESSFIKFVKNFYDAEKKEPNSKK
ncbi:MAG: hypothetical protein ACRC6K_06160 [Fusobacteriaceae bacterium]